MSTEVHTRRAATVVAALAAVGVVVAVGLLLVEHGPGNMGAGFLQGAGFAVVAAAVMGWRVSRHPDRATTFERAWTQSGDERDDAVLTRALAVLGLHAVPLTGVAAVAVALGAAVEMVLALLLLTEVLVGAVAFVAVARRS